MRKSIWIFLLAVLLPSVVLGWLALRSAEEQKIILERRTAELYQKEADNVAAAARAVIDEERRGFADLVRKLVAGEDPQKLAGAFTKTLAAAWPRKAIGFVIGADGRLLSPSSRTAVETPELQQFMLDNCAFLSGQIAVTVYPVPVEDLNRPDQMKKSKGAYNNEPLLQDNSWSANAANRRAMPASKEATAPNAPAVAKSAEALTKNRAGKTEGNPLAATSQMRSQTPNQTATPPASVPAPGSRQTSPLPAPVPAAPPSSVNGLSPEQAVSNALGPQLQSDALKQSDSEASSWAGSKRNVSPQQRVELTDREPVSNLWSATTGFGALCVGSDEGMVTRFVQDRLDVIFWLRPAQAPQLIFGCLIEAESLQDLWAATMPNPEYRSSLSTDTSEFVLALLDDKARPMVTDPAGTTGRDWKRPFVASEIGEALPHWEAALYLMRPEQLQESARGVRRTLILLIVSLLAAIACGGWLVVHDARRQLVLAQQKTDFVSNVSHELKTPLTSIRMFAELMQNGRAETASKAPQYLRIIMVEAERLTRLINNVLDFAKLERRQKRFDKKPLDLHAVLERTWEAHELHLQENGFQTSWQASHPPYPVIGDEDALAQILVNLLSNAEKYAGAHKEVAIHSYLDGQHVCVSVLDRGSGVAAGEERKIFEAFYRAYDSLSSGIQGSGLGLTLAQRLAQEHGGEIIYRSRPDGGSSFTLRLPLDANPQPV